jgi:hypothetical protein
MGLFGVVGTSGVVKNLGLTNVNIAGSRINYTYAGGVAGVNNGTIENCYVTGEVTCTGGIGGNAGGIAGRNDSDGIIQNCYTTAKIKATGSAGGVVGNNNGGKIINCVALNERVETENNASVLGRVVGSNSGTLENNRARHPGMTLTYSGGATKTPDSNLNGVDGLNFDWNGALPPVIPASAMMPLVQPFDIDVDFGFDGGVPDEEPDLIEDPDDGEPIEPDAEDPWKEPEPIEVPDSDEEADEPDGDGEPDGGGDDDDGDDDGAMTPQEAIQMLNSLLSTCSAVWK